MKTVNSPWLLAMIMSSLVLSGCNDLDFDMGDEPEEVVEEPAPEPAPEPIPEPVAPEAASVEFVPEQIKVFSFVWSDVEGATSYRLLENPDGLSGFTQVGDPIAPGIEMASVGIESVSLLDRVNAEYMLESCNDVGCTASDVVYVADQIVDAIGYVKSINTSTNYAFGGKVKVSGDGNTIVVSQYGDASASQGVYADETDKSGNSYGSAQVFVKVDGRWEFDAYIKASNAGETDQFGWDVAISDDGNVIAVSARGERSNSVNSPENNDLFNAGAAYVFQKSAGIWSETAYLKPGTPKAQTQFGKSIDLSGDGLYLVVGSPRDNSGANTINGNEADTSMSRAGAVHVYKLDAGAWSQHAYLKASNAGGSDEFGETVAISDDGAVVVVGAAGADAIGDAVAVAGNAYIYKRSADTWTEDAILSASTQDEYDEFGSNVEISGDGSTVVIGAWQEDSAAFGINGDETDNSLTGSGATYVFADSGSQWLQEAYIKPAMPEQYGFYGYASSGFYLNETGDKLYIGNQSDSANSVGLEGNEFSTGKPGSGAVSVYERVLGVWESVNFIKASNAEATDKFGSDVSVSEDESTIVVGAFSENSNGKLLDNNQSNNDAISGGAVYIY